MRNPIGGLGRRKGSNQSVLSQFNCGCSKRDLTHTMSNHLDSADSYSGGTPDDVAAYHDWVAASDAVALATGADTLGEDFPFTILAAVGDTTAEAVGALAETLGQQTHEAWELILFGTLHAAWPRQLIAQICIAEERVRMVAPSPDGNQLTAALTDSNGSLICVLDPGDTLARDALQRVAGAFAATPYMDLLYSDEDVMDTTGRRAPRFKSTFSADLLIAGNFVGQLAVYRRALFECVAESLDDGSPTLQYDLVVGAASRTSADLIGHIPAVLCHKARPPTDWPLPATVERLPIPGLLDVWQGDWPRARFALPDPLPLVSIIVATRDRAELLEACLNGLFEGTDYRAVEILVVDNGSEEATAIALLDQLEAKGRVRVLHRPGPFNFSALNNAAAAEARGEILLLLNNDIEVVKPDWLGVLVSHAIRPGVGIVGAKLLYPDGRIQHAGMLLGPGGTATHVGRGAPADAVGYDGQLACTRDLSAVTGACLAIRRSVFHAVGGLDERLEVTWNDVDLCLKVRAASLRVVWTPEAVLLHREAATRGLEADDPAKHQRFQRERALMQSKWGAALDNDPFLNANLLAHEDGRMILAQPPHARVPQ